MEYEQNVRLSPIALALRGSGLWTRLARSLDESPVELGARPLRPRGKALYIFADRVLYFAPSQTASLYRTTGKWLVSTNNQDKASASLYDSLDSAALAFVANAWLLASEGQAYQP